jgi:hypothetical protein
MQKALCWFLVAALGGCKHRSPISEDEAKELDSSKVVTVSPVG